MAVVDKPISHTTAFFTKQSSYTIFYMLLYGTNALEGNITTYGPYQGKLHSHECNQCDLHVSKQVNEILFRKRKFTYACVCATGKKLAQENCISQLLPKNAV